MTPSLTDALYREFTAQYIEGLAYSLNVGMGYVDDKARRKIVRQLYQSAQGIRQPKAGIKMKELTKSMPVVNEPIEDRSKIVVKTMDDFLKERKLKMMANQTKPDTTPRPPGRHR